MIFIITGILAIILGLVLLKSDSDFGVFGITLIAGGLFCTGYGLMPILTLLN